MPQELPKGPNEIAVPIKGMHCRSCELLIERELSGLPGVDQVRVDHRTGEACIRAKEAGPDMSAVESSIIKAGYAIGTSAPKAWLSRDLEVYVNIFVAILTVIIAYIVLSALGFSKLSVVDSGVVSYPVILLFGLTASVSTCMALIGGLVLGLSARYAEMNPDAKPRQKFEPHIYFNFGRVVSYALLGGVLGAVGSVMTLSTTWMGLLIVVIAILMLVLGVQLTGVSPRLENFKFTLPPSIARRLGINSDRKVYTHRGAALLGVLTFFVPCGFTQAMQLLAISSGSFFKGSLIMAIFALGTVPGMLGIGGLASLVKGAFAQRFFVFTGVVVIGFAFFNLGNGLRLAGWNFKTGGIPASAASVPVDQSQAGVQIVRMAQTAHGYNPSHFVIRAGVPVKWIIDSQSPYTCASTILMPDMNIQKNLSAGENIITFTPDKPGRLGFSCSMGMYTGEFIVQ